MAGKDASYAFAMMSLKAEDAHANLAGTLGMLTRPARHGPLGPGFAAPELGSCTSSRRACLAALGSSGLESPRGASALPLGA